MAIYIINEIFLLLGGIAVFMLGLKMLGSGVKISPGGRAGKLIGRCSGNSVLCFFAGAGVTAIAQSSVAVSVIAVGLVESGVMSFYGAAGVVMGANVGTTVTAQIISVSGSSSFNVTAIGSLLAFGGIVASSFDNKKVGAAGRLALGLGLIFIGIEIMSASVERFKGFLWFRNIFMMSNPLLLVLNGILVTGIVQSSSAVTGMMIVLAGNGLIGFESAMFLILGSNIGSCFPVIIASMKKGEAARRTAFFNLFFNLFGTLIFFPFLLLFGEGFSSAFTSGRSVERCIADFHTLFNVVISIITLPLLKPFTKLVSAAVYDKRAPVYASKL